MIAQQRRKNVFWPYDSSSRRSIYCATSTILLHTIILIAIRVLSPVGYMTSNHDYMNNRKYILELKLITHFIDWCLTNYFRDAKGVGVLDYLGYLVLPNKAFLRLQDIKYIIGDYNQYFTAIVNRIIVQCKSFLQVIHDVILIIAKTSNLNPFQISNYELLIQLINIKFL